jgi:hypothetical protein
MKINSFLIFYWETQDKFIKYAQNIKIYFIGGMKEGGGPKLGGGPTPNPGGGSPIPGGGIIGLNCP